MAFSLPPDCTPASIFAELIDNGFSEAQAIGAMANAIAESSLNPEASVIDSNGARSNGLWQFNEASYPDSGKLVTGNCRADIAAQVGYLRSHVSGSALSGSTGAQVAGNFAANFERCQGCQPGGSSYNQRVGNAATVQGWVTGGKWPTGSVGNSGGGGGSGGSGGAGGGTAGASLTSFNPATCVIALPSLNLGVTSVGGGCLISKSEARAVIGALLLGGAGLLALVAVAILAAAGFASTGAGKAVTQAATAVTPVGRAVGVAARAGR